MMKNIITLSVDKTTSDDTLKALREQYTKEGYVVHIVKSGYKDNKEWLSEFLNARLNA